MGTGGVGLVDDGASVDCFSEVAGLVDVDWREDEAGVMDGLEAAVVGVGCEDEGAGWELEAADSACSAAARSASSSKS